MIDLRNETGKDERSKHLWYLFLKEIKIRLEMNNVFVKLGEKKLNRLPDGLNVYIQIFIYVWKLLLCTVDLIILILREINDCKGEREKNNVFHTLACNCSSS